MDSIKTGGSKMAPMSADQSERSNLLTIEAIGVCPTLVIEGSAITRAAAGTRVPVGYPGIFLPG